MQLSIKNTLSLPSKNFEVMKNGNQATESEKKGEPCCG